MLREFGLPVPQDMASEALLKKGINNMDSFENPRRLTKPEDFEAVN